MEEIWLNIIFWIVLFGLVFDYTNGFHDAANVVSTVIATRVLTPITAIVLAGILNTVGATQISGVAKTIAEGLVQPHFTTQMMVLSALVGAVIWNVCTWHLGIPSSSSYALIGGLIGPALFYGGMEIILWKGLIYKVILPMILSPFLGFFLGFIGMKGVNFLLKFPLVKRHEKIFNKLQIVSASLIALAHGLNDAQKSMGIITLGLFAGGYITAPHIPFWVIMSCALVMGLGTATGGFRIIRTVGYGITKLEPSHGFVAETSASSVILLASFLGMPLSSTHMIVGSITGVGSVNGVSKVRWDTARAIIWTWFLTLPGAAILAILVFKLTLKSIERLSG